MYIIPMVYKMHRNHQTFSQNDLIQVAEHLLEQKGIEDFKLEDISEIQGIHPKLLSSTFHDRIFLLSVLAENGFKQLQAICKLAEHLYPDNPKQQLRYSGQGYVRFAVQKPVLLQLMFGGNLDFRQCPESLQNQVQSSFNELSHIIRNGQKTGVYQIADTNELSLTTWSLMQNLAMAVAAGQVATVAKASEQLNHISDRVCDIIMQGTIH